MRTLLLVIVLLASLSLPCLAVSKKLDLSCHALTGLWTRQSFGDVKLGTIKLSYDGTFKSDNEMGTWRSTAPQAIELRFAKSGKCVKWHWDEGMRSGELSVLVFDQKDVKQDDFQLIPIVPPTKSLPGIANPLSPIVGTWDKGPVPIVFERNGKVIFGGGNNMLKGTWKTTGVNKIIYQYEGRNPVQATWVIEGNYLMITINTPGDKPLTLKFLR